MDQLWSLILGNLRNIGIGLLLFAGAYLSNICFSLWTNIKMAGEKFDGHRLAASAVKLLAFGGGLVLLSAVITTLPLFADTVGWAIPEEYKDVFANLIILAMFLTATCVYVREALAKVKKILFPEG